MFYKSFSIKNYRGIKEIQLDLSNNRILTLVGLNESGKTTALEAINWLYKCIKKQSPTIEDLNYFRPKGIAFTGTIFLEAKIGLEDYDKEEIKNYWLNSLNKRKDLEIPDEFIYSISFEYKQHEYKRTDVLRKFDIKRSGAKNNLFDTDKSSWDTVVSFVENNLIPEVIFYQDFLFDIPEEILFATTEDASMQHSSELSQTLNKQWQNVLDDILMDVKKEFNSFQQFVANKWISDNETARQRVNSMQTQLNDKITSAWKELFKEKRPHFKEIKLIPTPQNGLLRISFKVTSERGIDFPINDRSKGFKWFFSFLIFTEFRKNRSRNILFLLDEPASNLHSSAQGKILNALENLSRDAMVVYSTHSHHLIKPEWLKGAYIVINEVITDKRLEGNITFEEGATITAEGYFKYVGKGLGNVNVSYFQPILDRLDYAPSILEPIPEIVITEGRDDWFTFSYINYALFNNKYDIKFYPGAGKDQLWEPIRIYLSWGKKFLVILDGDKGGDKSKKGYLKEFDKFLEDKIFTLKDILNQEIETEDLIGDADKKSIIDEAFGKGCYDSTTSNPSLLKSKLNLAIKQFLANKIKVKFHKNTENNFSKLFEFIVSNLKHRG
jgi:energy-coupling factor transporter ATP-binding protein EcfA2